MLESLRKRFELKNPSDVYAVLVPQLEGSTTILEAAEAVAKTTGGNPPTPVVLRNLLRQGIKAGRIKKDTSAYAVANIPSGRKPGYSPKAAKAAA